MELAVFKLHRVIFNNMLLHYVLNYFFIGSIYGFFTMVMNNYLTERDSNVPRFNILENIILIICWPVYLILFIYYIFKKD